MGFDTIEINLVTLLTYLQNIFIHFFGSLELPCNVVIICVCNLGFCVRQRGGRVGGREVTFLHFSGIMLCICGVRDSNIHTLPCLSTLSFTQPGDKKIL